MFQGEPAVISAVDLPDLPPFETAEVTSSDAPTEGPDDSDSGTDVPKSAD